MKNISLSVPAGPGLGGANLVEMSQKELLNINGGGWWRYFFKQGLVGAMIDESINLIEEGINEFRDGWNSHQC